MAAFIGLDDRFFDHGAASDLLPEGPRMCFVPKRMEPTPRLEKMLEQFWDNHRLAPEHIIVSKEAIVILESLWAKREWKSAYRRARVARHKAETRLRYRGEIAAEVRV